MYMQKVHLEKGSFLVSELSPQSIRNKKSVTTETFSLSSLVTIKRKYKFFKLSCDLLLVT